MTVYHLDVQAGTARVVLWVDTQCGSRPILTWHKLEAVRDFADMLLDLYWKKEVERLNVNEVAERLLEESLGGQ